MHFHATCYNQHLKHAWVTPGKGPTKIELEYFFPLYINVPEPSN